MKHIIDVKIKSEAGYMVKNSYGHLKKNPSYFLKPKRNWRKQIATEALVRPGFGSAVVTWNRIDPLDPDLTTSKEFTKAEIEAWSK